MKPVERQSFSGVVWEQFLFLFILFLFYVYAAKPYAGKLFWKLEATRNECGYVESLQLFFGVLKLRLWVQSFRKPQKFFLSAVWLSLQSR